MASNYLTLSILGKDVSAGTTLDSVAKKVETTAGKFSAAGEKMSSIGKKMTVGVTLPVIGLGVAAVNSEKEFSKSMAQISVATGAGGSEMTKLSGYAKKMGADTVFSSGEAADAMLNLAKGGFTPAQITGGALAATMSLAAAGNLDLADAANQTVAAMNTFGVSADKAGTIADALAGGANASSADVGDLGDALAQTGSAAKATGQSLNDTVAALALLADHGIKGQDAGTSLKTMLTRLVPATKAARNEMHDLGIDFQNADGSMKSLPQVAGILHDKLAGLTEAQRLSAVQTIFGTDAQRAALALYDSGATGLQKYVAATEKQGNAQKMANAQMSGTAGAIEQMNGSLETAALSIGQALAPTVTDLSNRVAELANWFSALDPEVQGNIVKALALAAAVGPATMVVGKLTSTVSTGIKVYKKGADAAGKIAEGYRDARVAASAFSGRLGSLGGGLAKVTGFIGRMNIGTKLAAAAQWAWNVALDANPIVLIVIAIAALVAGLVWFFTQTKLGQDIWQGFVNALGTAWTWLWTSILKPTFDAIGAAFTWLWTTIIKPVVDFISGAFQVLGALALVFWVYALQPALAAAGAMFTWLWVNIIQPALAGIGALFGWLWTTIIQPVIGFIIGYVKLLAGIYIWLWQAVVWPAIQAIGAVISWLWTNVVLPVVGFIIGQVKALGAIFSWLWVNGIQPAINAIGNILNWIWNSIIRPVFNSIGSAVRTVGGVFSSIFGGIGNIVRDAFSTAMHYVSWGINKVIDLVNGAIGAINTLGQMASSVTGGNVSWHVSKIPHIPALAKGGLVTAATLALIGEGAEPEVVAPLSKVPELLGTAGQQAPQQQAGGGSFHLTIQNLRNTSPAEMMQDALWYARRAGFRFEGKTG